MEKNANEASRTPKRFSSCPLCDNEEITYAFQVMARRLDECSRCGLLFFNPQPSDRELSEIYREGYLLGEKTQGLSERVPGLKRASARILLGLVSDYSGRQDGNGKRLLDIGCGGGFLLAEAEIAGYDVTGTDVSAELLRKAASMTNRAVLHQQDAETLDLPEESFDVCVMSDVLEHVRDPLAVLNRVWRFLRPGGIVLAAAPSLDSLSARIMKDKWVEFKIEHLFYFSRSNLQMALYKSNFSAIRMYPLKKKLDLAYVGAHFERFPPNSWLVRGVKGALNLAPEFVKRMPLTVGGSGMVAVATKDGGSRNNLKRLSVVLPVYNEKQTFPELVNQLLEKSLPDMEMELVVVESNSTDGTREEVLKLKGKDHVKIVLQDQPKGKGHAVREGLRHASGDIILIQDGDLEYDVWDYDALIRPITQLRCSFTLGARHKGNSWKMRRFLYKPALAWIMNLGHKMLTAFFNILFRQKLEDPFTMYKVFRRDCIRGIEFTCDRFDFDIELVIKLIKQGFIPVEIPVNYVSRSFAEGKKVSFSQDPLRIVKAMLKERLR
jgi:SAM-dependent methyltransferase